MIIQANQSLARIMAKISKNALKAESFLVCYKYGASLKN
jgi:hypothetical protein